MRALGVDPVHDTRETFRGLVDAMSRPGTVETTPVAPADYAVLSTLVDHEVAVNTTDDGVADALASEGRLAEAAFEEADVVHVRGGTDGRVVDATRGTLKEPSEGATVVYRVETLTTDPAAADVALSVCGPGVPGTRTLGVDGLPGAEFDAIAEAQSGYPRGIDVLLASERRVAALPRTVDLTWEVA